MKNEFLHVYYSGTDVVDTNEEWRNKNMGRFFCKACNNVMPNLPAIPDLVVEKKIPKKADMFSIGYNSPSLISEKFKSLIFDCANEYLNFSQIFLKNYDIKISSHFAVAGKQQWTLLFGEVPSIIDGNPVANPQIRICPLCKTRFGYGRGKRYVDSKINEIKDVAFTEFGGILLKNDIIPISELEALKNVRLEKIEVR
ncbi:MAG: hypothetical protein V4754_12460 [Pseudomonadota bacterium]